MFAGTLYLSHPERREIQPISASPKHLFPSVRQYRPHRTPCQPNRTLTQGATGKVVYSKGNDHIIDAVRYALLIREEESLDQGGEEVISLKPVLTDPVFV